MSTYREIIGKKIKKVSSDPSSGFDGEMWYNSTTGTLRGLAVIEAWSSASPMITGREFGSSGIGTQAANIVASGYDYGPGARVTNTEEYNGSGWTSITAISEGKFLAGGAGSVTAGLVFGGTSPPYTGNTEEYNGSSWAEQTNMTTARSVYCGAGGPSGQTAGLAAGGYNGTNSNATEEYNGSSWTNGGNLGTARRAGTAFGTQTAASYVTGYITAPVNTVEDYNGTSWTTGTSTNVSKSSDASSSMSQTSAVVFGGNGPGTGVTTNESWDGTSWAVAPTLATGRAGLNGAGTGTAAIAASGFTTPPDASPAITEEFNSTTNIITAAAWASGAVYPASLEGVRGAGIQTAAVAAGGETAPGPMVTTTNEYDGTSWTGSGALPAARGNGAAFGTEAAGVYATGYNSSNQPTVYNYNGSAWTASPGTVNTARRALSGSGTSTAGIIWGGYTTTGVNNAEEWNGSAMSNGGTLNTARYNPGGFGTQTATLAVCGNTPPPNADTAASEEYNGASWTSGNNNLHALRMGAIGAGTQTDGIVFGGYDGSSPVGYTTGYDGTAWSTRPAMGTARNNHGSTQSSPSVNALAIAGGPYTTAVEEYTTTTETSNIENFTTS